MAPGSTSSECGEDVVWDHFFGASWAEVCVPATNGDAREWPPASLCCASSCARMLARVARVSSVTGDILPHWRRWVHAVRKVVTIEM